MASELEQQTIYRLFGTELAGIAVDLVGAKNLELEAEGTPVDTSNLLQSVGAIRDLLMVGSLKTARSYLNYITPSFPVYADIFTEVVTRITAFLVGGGFEEEVIE